MLSSDLDKPKTKHELEMEMLLQQTRVGIIQDPLSEFSDDTVKKALDAIGLGDTFIKSVDHGRTNLDTPK